MLILSRKLNESIVIDGRIIVKVLRIDRDTVKLGIQAPAELPVHRQEIFDAIQRSKQQGNPPGVSPGPVGPVPPTPAAGSRDPAPASTPPRRPGGSGSGD